MHKVSIIICVVKKNNDSLAKGVGTCIGKDQVFN